MQNTGKSFIWIWASVGRHKPWKTLLCFTAAAPWADIFWDFFLELSHERSKMTEPLACRGATNIPTGWQKTHTLLSRHEGPFPVKVIPKSCPGFLLSSTAKWSWLTASVLRILHYQNMLRTRPCPQMTSDKRCLESNETNKRLLI